MSGSDLKRVRERMSRTALVVDDLTLASTEQMSNPLKATIAMRLPLVVVVGEEKRLDGVDCGTVNRKRSRLVRSGAARANALLQRQLLTRRGARGTSA